MKKISEIGFKVSPTVDSQAVSKVKKELSNSFQGLATEVKNSGEKTSKELEKMFGSLLDSVNSIDITEKVKQSLIQLQKLHAEFRALKNPKYSKVQEYDARYTSLINSPELSSFGFPAKRIRNLSSDRISSALLNTDTKISGLKREVDIEREKTRELNKQLEVQKEIQEETKEKNISYKEDKKLLDDSLSTLKKYNKEKIDKSREYLSLLDDESDEATERKAKLKSEIDTLEKKESIEKRLIKNLKTQVDSHKKINHQIKESWQNATTLQKIFDRVAFVLTARFSYAGFDFLSRSLAEGRDNAIKLEAQLTRIAQISKGQSQEFISNSVKESLRYGLNIDDVTKSAYDAVSSQFSTMETEQLMDVSRKMAIAGFTEQNEAMDALTTVINAYGMEVSEATKVSDIFFKTIELGKTELKEIAPDIGKISATASLLGISFEEISAGLATMTLNGIKTNVAVTSLNQLLLNLTKPTDEAKKIFDKYNISLDISQIKVKGLAGMVSELNKLTDEEIATIASSNRGFRALATAINSGTEWTENYNKIMDATNSTQIAFNEQMETADMKLKTVAGEFRLVGITIWEKVLPAINFLAEGVSILLKGFDSWIGVIVSAGVAITGLIIGLKSLGAVMLANWQISAVVVGLSLIASIQGLITKKNQEMSRYAKEASEAELTKIDKELTGLRRKQSLLLTLKDLSEKEAKNAKLSKNEKALLVSVEKELGDKYNISKDNLKNYNKELESNTALIEENEKAKLKAWRQANLQQFEDAKSGLKTSTFSLSRLSEAFQYTKAQFANREKDSYMLNAIEKGSLSSERLKSLSGMLDDKSDARTNLRFLKEARDSYTEYETALQNILISSGTSSEKRQQASKALSSFRAFITQEKKANIDFLIKWYEMENTEKREIKKIEVSSQSGANTGGSSEPKFNQAFWNEAKAGYKNQTENFKELSTLLSKREQFSAYAKSFYSKEPETASAIIEGSKTDVISLVNQRYRKDIKEAQNAIDSAKTVDAILSGEAGLKKVYESFARDMAQIGDTAEQVAEITAEMESVFAKFDIEADIAKKLRELALTKEKEITELEYAQKNNKEFFEIWRDFDNMSLVEIQDFIARNNDFFSLYQTLNSQIQRRINERNKSNSLLSAETKGSKGSVFSGFMDALGFKQKEEMFSEYENLSKLSPSELTPELKKRKEELGSLISEEKGKDIGDATKNMLSASLDMYKQYLDSRIEQIDAEKEAKLKAIDETAKVEYRSAWWVQAEKEKAEKKAEKEKRKINKQKKQMMIAEAIANTALGITNIWSKWAGLPVVASLLTAMLLGTAGLQYKTIEAQKFEFGGKINGKRHSQGGTLINAEDGEMVVRRSAVPGNEKFINLLNSNPGLLSADRLIARNVSSPNLQENSAYQNQMIISNSINSIASAVEKIQMTVELHGEFISDVKLAKRVRNGNSQTRRI